MATPRKNATLQERFGFADPDLTTPAHDQILLWLRTYAPQWIREESGFHQPSRDIVESQAYAQEALDDYAEYLRSRQEYFRCYPEVARSCDEQLAWVERQRGHPFPVPPPLDIRIDKLQSEFPVSNDRGFVVGAIDLVCVAHGWEYLADWGEYGRNVVHREKHMEAPPHIAAIRDPSPTWFYFEIKTTIPSFGELMRQLRLYQHAHGAGGWFVVVSPDTRWRGPITDEGFEFIEVPAGVV